MIDHIVFTAGDSGGAITPLKDITSASFQKMGTVRFVGPMVVAKQALTHLSPGPRSSFTFTTGSSAEKAPPGWAIPVSYGGGLISMARGLAVDMKPIRVNIISPGAVDTEIWKMDEKVKKKFLKGLLRSCQLGGLGGWRMLRRLIFML